jgi:hypothetical protein
METIKFRLTGTAPLLMHNARLSNPLDPYSIKLGPLVKGKTDEERRQAALVEWEGGLYYDEAIGPYVPGENLETLVRDGAKFQRKGKKVQQGLMVLEDRVPLEYEGPRTLEKLLANPEYMDYRSCRPGGRQSRVMRSRPRFNRWALNFTVIFNTEVLNERDVILSLQTGGNLIGLGDYRPRFGKYTAEVL